MQLSQRICISSRYGFMQLSRYICITSRYGFKFFFFFGFGLTLNQGHNRAGEGSGLERWFLHSRWIHKWIRHSHHFFCDTVRFLFVPVSCGIDPQFWLKSYCRWAEYGNSVQIKRKES